MSFSIASPPFLRQGIPLNLEFDILAKALELQICSMLEIFLFVLTKMLDLNSGLHDSTASISPTESSAQP